MMSVRSSWAWWEFLTLRWDLHCYTVLWYFKNICTFLSHDWFYTLLIFLSLPIYKFHLGSLTNKDRKSNEQKFKSLIFNNVLKAPAHPWILLCSLWDSINGWIHLRAITCIRTCWANHSVRYNFMFFLPIKAPCEAEASCAALVKGGKVFATATEDMDGLTFGTNILLRHLTASEAKYASISTVSLC